MKDFIPSSDPKLVAWSINFKTKLALRGPDLGLTVVEIEVENNRCDGMIEAIAVNVAARTAHESTSAAKKEIVQTNIFDIRNFIKNIKRNPAYTVAIGAELGILGTSVPFDPAVYKSVLKVSMHPGYVTVKFIKKGAEGINLYGRQNGETNWTKLGFFGHSPCVDVRTVPVAGQATNREYMCIGVLKDREIGVQSDIVSLAFAG